MAAGEKGYAGMAVLNIVQIVISVILVAVILVQVKGQGGGLLGGGGGESSFRTRRGLEKTLFQFTIFMVVVFIAMSILSVRFA